MTFTGDPTWITPHRRRLVAKHVRTATPTAVPLPEFTPRLRHGDTGIRAVQARLHACLDGPHCMEDLARTATTHPRTFQRRFREATGLTATEDTQAARIAKARASLELTDVPVTQISRRLGHLETGLDVPQVRGGGPSR
ncbi:helix-turn-helix domain-containing protein [Kitasatospora cineracea]|uniref:helix-turn-helix domain-containing protein n=1 Tax=Kitasatospora cineracea TaxID=88074 RepID=UPI0037912077